jgi:sialate O-acetylesterase
MKLAKVFSNGMVLQRQKPVYIWGESQPNQMVRAEIQGKSAEVMADETGHFCLKIH